MYEALSAAEPALREIGSALGAGREVVIVAGNHDHHLVAPWFDRRYRLSDPGATWSRVDGRLERALDAITAVARRRLGSGRLPGRMAARRRLRDARPLPRPSHDGPGVRADRRRGDGPGRRASSGWPASGRGLRGRALADVRLDPRDRADGGRDMEETSHGPSTRARQALDGTDGRRSIRRLGLLAALPGAACRRSTARGSGPLRSDLSGQELRRAGLRSLRRGAGATRGGRVARDLRAHAPRRAAARRRSRASGGRRPGQRCSTPAAGSTSRRGSGRDPTRSPYRPGFARRWWRTTGRLS